MIYLGLGSNLGDRIGMLQRALRLLYDRQIILPPIRISSVYRSPALLPENSPPEWDREFFNVVLEARTELSPIELLRACKKIELELGREPSARWSPRLIDIDFLFDQRGDLNSEDLVLPHPGLRTREFVFLPLRELGVEVASGQEASQCEAIPTKVFPVEIVGVLNLTPDSFSDGNLFMHPELAERQFAQLIAEGASIIDIGAESTRPNATPLSAKEEWERLEASLELIVNQRNNSYPWIKLSLDSRHLENMERALWLGIDWVNDVSAAKDEKTLQFFSSESFDFVLMHHLSIPADRNIVFSGNQDPLEEVMAWGNEKLESLEKFGINRGRCILDPGIGFGKNPEQSLRLIQKARDLKKLGCRLMYGHSRKSFLQLFSKEPPLFRDVATAYFSAFLMKQGVDYLRVHSAAHTRQAIEASLLISEVQASA